MKIVKYSQARQNLRSILDECHNSNEPVKILSKESSAIVISEDQYKIMITQINKDK